MLPRHVYSYKVKRLSPQEVCNHIVARLYLEHKSGCPDYKKGVSVISGCRRVVGKAIRRKSSGSFPLGYCLPTPALLANANKGSCMIKVSNGVKAPAAILETAFQDKLKSSGLSLVDAKTLGLEIYTALGMKELKVPEYDGFKIPYFDFDGNPTKFYRVRYLQDTRTGFAKMAKAKALRYTQPKNTINEVYMPPSLDWAKMVKDVTIPLIITEGELKAACACKLKLATAGLGGVWCFRSANNDLPLIEWFNTVQWKYRTVYIVYDSDAATNHNVMAAEVALCKELIRLGAVPHIVRLPRIEGQAKTGLDDYLLVKSKVDLADLLESSEPYKQAEFLHKLNTEVVYVRNPGLILKLHNLQRMQPRAFTDHAYSNQTYYETEVTEKGTKLVLKYAAREWMRWRMRAEVEKVAYAPGEDRIVNGDCLNVWPGWGVEPVKGDVTLWSQLLDYLFKGMPDERKWFEQWCAYPLQNPGAKLYTAPLLWGIHTGTGKTLVGYTLLRIYGKNGTSIEEEHLHSTHNEWAENKQFIVGDEITSGDKRAVAEKMKSIITRKSIRLNPKFISSYDIDDCINYYFTSNHADAFFLEDKDRRYFIHEVKGAPLARPFYVTYDDWYKSDKVSSLFAHLLQLGLKGFDPRGPAPMTHSKMEMIDVGKSDIARWVGEIAKDPDAVLAMDHKPLMYKLWTSEDLLKLYDPMEKTRVTQNGISRELTKMGFSKAANGESVRTFKGKVRLWMLREPDIFSDMTVKEIGFYYDKERAMPTHSKLKFTTKGNTK